MDGDGDEISAEQTFNLGEVLQFVDDGPSFIGEEPISIDFGDSVLQVKDAETLNGETSVASVALTDVVTFADVDFGGDLEGSITQGYTLALGEGNDNSPTLASGGQPITLSVSEDGQTLTATITVDGEEQTVFTLAITEVEGLPSLVLTQYLPIDHSDTDNADAVKVLDGLVALSASITAVDGDGDEISAEQTFNLGE
ncbi:DUF5801 repeats-in-toxin domain-containing protein, partial [Streptomyces heliomycini]